MTQTQTRRETLKQIGLVTVASGAAIPAFGGVVSATDSGDAELTLTGTIPDTTQIDATVEEYDTQSASSAISTQTETVTSGGSTTVFGSLDAQADYYYVFDLQLIGNGSETPELDALFFEVPLDFADVDYTDELDWQAKADATTIEFDEQYLYEYQPLLRMEPSTREEHKGMYGYVARSDDHETDALCFWTQLTHQDGLPGVSSDTHLGDHEPIYVFVNSETGVVDEIVYSAYHWFTGSQSITNPSEELQTARAGEPTHPVLSVSEQWHNYSYETDVDGAFVELKSWPEVRDTWLRNEFYAPADVDVIEDPWQIRDSDGWWQPGTVDSWVAGAYSRVGSLLGLYGADEADNWE